MLPWLGRTDLGERMIRLCFPPRCLGCHARLPAHARFEVVCDGCFASIPRLPWLRCPTCGARRSSIGAGCHGGTTLAAAAPFGNATVRALVHALKYQSVRRAALPLAALILEHLTLVGPMYFPQLSESRRFYLRSENFALGQLSERDGARAQGAARASVDTRCPRVEFERPLPLIPVPLHPRRERKRGYNQATLIAEALAALVPGRFSIQSEVLCRVRYTEPQVQTPNRKTRERNVQGSFAACGEQLIPLVPRAFLIDDVATTGATLEAASRALRSAGARRILCITAAVSERQ